MDEYIAYHGTSSECVESIKNNGFKPSISHNEWLGCGVYFFIDGSFCPITNAREWAKNSAWDKQEKKNTYTNYSILKVSVSGERILDLRIEEDLRIFNLMREHILKRYEEEKNNFERKPHPDTFLCNSITKSMKLNILIQNLYIKTKYQRINKIDSRIPNATVLCAKESANIELANIEEIEKEIIE
jgi:hypothetical protein